ncbi:MAG: 50S ribosomal protein L21 [Planctomycetota bacterium]|nr:MAG: 50S ribosomal protein L21 [Planctomycetota bacterium]
MYAIIEESGGQRKVSQGEEIFIDLYQQGQAEKGATITFDRVLVVGEPGGGARIGTPFVDGAAVSAEVIEPVVKGDKIYVHKFRPKKGYKRKTGHRQRYTQVRITAINA